MRRGRDATLAACALAVILVVTLLPLASSASGARTTGVDGLGADPAVPSAAPTASDRALPEPADARGTAGGPDPQDAPPVAPAASPDLVLGMATLRDVAIDPVSGRVFVAGDDEVVVVAPDGTLLATIPGVSGAFAISIAGPSAWVTSSTAGTIVQVDIAELTVVHSYPVGAVAVGGVVALNGSVWFVRRVSATALWSIAVLAPSTGVVTNKGGTLTGGFLRAIPGSSTQLLANAGYNDYDTSRVNIAVSPVAVVGAVTPIQWRSGPLGVGYAFSADGALVWTRSNEYRTSDMSITGLQLPPHAAVLASSTSRGGILATQDESDLVLTLRGRPREALRTPQVETIRGAVFSPDASSLYTLRTLNAAVLLKRIVIEPKVEAVAPTLFVTGQGGEATITGEGLGLFTEARIDGAEVSRSTYSPTELHVQVPRTVPAGTRTLSLSGPYGTITRSLTIAPNQGATVSGRVTHLGQARAGVQVQLSGAALPTPRAATSDAGGNFSFTAVPTGTDFVEYQLDAHDPSGDLPDLHRRNLFFAPNVTTTADLVLGSTTPTDPTRARQPMPPRADRHAFYTTVRGTMVQAPAVGRTFVSVMDEVDVFSRTGERVARLDDLWGADGMVLWGSDLYVNLTTAGQIVRIDVATLSITGRWSINLRTNGVLARAAGKLWVTTWDDQFAQLASFDPATGVVAADTSGGTATLYQVPMLFSVVGDANKLLLTNSSAGTRLVDVGTMPPTNGAYYRTFSAGEDVAMMSGPDRFITGSSVVFSLPSLEVQQTGGDLRTFPFPAGIYDRWGGVTRSAAAGGTIQFGPFVFFEATKTLSQYLVGCTTASNGQEIDPAGDRTSTLCGDALVVSDLRPRADGVEPFVSYPTPSTVTIVGDGFGGATKVTFDGTSVPFTVADTKHIAVSVPASSPGHHSLVVTTPFGTSLPVDMLFQAVPHVVSVSPPSGPVAGGVPVTIKGTNLRRVTSVAFGDRWSGKPTVVDDSTLTVVSPVGVAGTVDVVASTPLGAGTSAASFTFVAPRPAITGAQLKRGPVAGGYEVWFDGTGLLYPTGAAVDGVATPAYMYSDTRVRIVMPPHAAGIASVSITTAGGTSAPGPEATFTYTTDKPTITKVAPREGPANGWTAVTVDGTNLTGTKISLSGVEVSASIVSDTRMSVSAPPHAVGTVTVVATNSNGSSLPDDASTFRYFSPFSAPSAPTAVVAAPRRASAFVSWSAPVTTAASPTGYTAVAAPGGATCTANMSTGPQLSCSIPDLTPGTPYTVTVTATNASGTSPASAPSSPVVPVSGSFFHPLAPQRLLDSRRPAGAWSGPLSASSPKTLSVVAGGSQVPSNAEAVVVNITVTGSTANSFLTAYPAGGAIPTASNLNFAAGETVANLATVKVGDGGQIALATASGSVHVVVDVVGYYSPDPGDRFTALAPARILDSRVPTDGWTGPLAAGAARTVPVRGAGGVPATASAVIMNVTATAGSTNSFLTVYPSGGSLPTASNVNFAPGQTVPNLVTVKIGADGAIAFNNAAGSVHVVADIVGFFDPTTGDVFHVLNPTRVLDSRGSTGGWAAPLVAGAPRTLSMSASTPDAATAVIGNATVTQPTANSFLTVYPGGPTVPSASNLNFGAGQTVPNLVAVKLAPGQQIAFANAAGSTQVIFDLVGYFQPW